MVGVVTEFVAAVVKPLGKHAGNVLILSRLHGYSWSDRALRGFCGSGCSSDGHYRLCSSGATCAC